MTLDQLASCATAGPEVSLDAAPTIASLSGDGVYEVATYTDFPDPQEFGDGTIYYPLNTAAPIGGVADAGPRVAKDRV